MIFDIASRDSAKKSALPAHHFRLHQESREAPASLPRINAESLHHEPRVESWFQAIVDASACHHYYSRDAMRSRAAPLRR